MTQWWAFLRALQQKLDNVSVWLLGGSSAARRPHECGDLNAESRCYIRPRSSEGQQSKRWKERRHRDMIYVLGSTWQRVFQHHPTLLYIYKSIRLCTWSVLWCCIFVPCCTLSQLPRNVQFKYKKKSICIRITLNKLLVPLNVGGQCGWDCTAVSPGKESLVII